MDPTLHSVSALSRCARAIRRHGARGLRLLPGLGLLLPGLAGAVTPQPLDGYIITSDFGLPSMIRVMDPAQNKVVYDYNFEKETSESCQLKTVVCGSLGMGYAQHGGEDFLDMAMFVINSQGTGSRVKQYSVVQRVKPVKPTAPVIWKIKTLDFTSVPDGDKYCDNSAVDRSGAPTDSRCYPQLVHAIQVVDDVPEKKSVSVIMAEMDNHRVTRATLDYSKGSTQARVDWVIGPENPDWPGQAAVNGVQYIDNQPGGPYVLTTFYQATGEVPGGGMVMLWQWNGSDWESRWRFPEDVDDPRALPFINTPHMGEVLVDPLSGKPWIIYNHSRGTSGGWDSASDWGGSYGVLEPGATLAAPPTYKLDAVVYGTDPERQTQFSRDTDFLADGTMLLTDAACENTHGCEYPSRLFRVQPFQTAVSSTDRPGWYSPDERYLNRYNVPDSTVIQEYQCGYDVLFEAEFIPSTRLGTTLKSLAAQSTTPCPAPTWGRTTGVRSR